jgi:hypothetical protein
MRVETNIKAGKPLGEAIADLTHATGLDQLAHQYERVTGRSCGCEQRRQWLNQLFP